MTEAASLINHSLYFSFFFSPVPLQGRGREGVEVFQRDPHLAGALGADLLLAQLAAHAPREQPEAGLHAEEADLEQEGKRGNQWLFLGYTYIQLVCKNAPYSSNSNKIPLDYRRFYSAYS